MNVKLTEYNGNPAAALLELAEMAREAGNDRLRRMWLANYLRVSEGARGINGRAA